MDRGADSVSTEVGMEYDAIVVVLLPLSLSGMMKGSDQTDVLRKTSYWPSFNIA